MFRRIGFSKPHNDVHISLDRLHLFGPFQGKLCTFFMVCEIREGTLFPSAHEQSRDAHGFISGLLMLSSRVNSEFSETMRGEPEIHQGFHLELP